MKPDSSKRQSGIALIGDVPWGTHFCQFYRTKEDLLEMLVPYFAAGLANNEYCMWVTSQPVSVEDATEAMRQAVPGFDAYVRKGQIDILRYDQWYTLGGRFDEKRVLDGWVSRLDGALKQGFAGLRLTGNTFWIEDKDWQAFKDYEAAVDSVLGNYRMLAMCTYSLEKCGVREIMDVVENHEFALALSQGQWQVVERKRWLA
ncbi:MAG: MEDS domain-containing protein [Sedimentisphaerales bacterium]|nr:MEDS domain-containing protein [Sedimentisphaerales bacterium]